MEMSYWRSGETKIQIWEPSATMIVKASVMNSITSGRYVALGQWFSTRGNFAPQIPGDATGIQWAEARDVAKHPAMNRTVLTTKHYLFQNVTNADVEKHLYQMKTKEENEEKLVEKRMRRTRVSETEGVKMHSEETTQTCKKYKMPLTIPSFSATPKRPSYCCQRYPPPSLCNCLVRVMIL